MKIIRKIKTFHILIILVCGICFIDKGTPLYGDDYVKVWDSGRAASNRLNDVDVGDTDGDGHPEIIVSDQPPGGGGKIYVFENTGDNFYELVWNSGNSLTMRVIDIAIGDQDNDGNLEIVAAESRNTPPYNTRLHVFENIGNNEYQEAWNSGNELEGSQHTTLFLGDADKDGKREIIVGTGPISVTRLRVYENTGDNDYQEVWNSNDIIRMGFSEGAVGDTDGDKKNEIIVGGGWLSDTKVCVFESNGDNSYQLVSIISGFGLAPQVTIGDQDRDGNMELIVGTQEGGNAVRVFEHTGSIGDNTYTEVWYSGTLAARIGLPVVGDQDHDGKREIIAPCLDAYKVYLFENTEDNDYQEVWNSGNVMKGLVERAVAGDQDGDGKGEIIAVSYDSKVYVFEHNVVELAIPFDIKPRACPNRLNVKKRGVLRAAILGTDNFDVNQVDITSLRLEGIAPIRSAFRDLATPFVPFIGKTSKDDCNKIGPDGFLDLVLKFNARKVIRALGKLKHRDIAVLQLRGNLREEFGGTPIKGEDVVVIILKNRHANF
jgi:hypothetical protein